MKFYLYTILIPHIFDVEMIYFIGYMYVLNFQTIEIFQIGRNVIN